MFCCTPSTAWLPTFNLHRWVLPLAPIRSQTRRQWPNRVHNHNLHVASNFEPVFGSRCCFKVQLGFWFCFDFYVCALEEETNACAPTPYEGSHFFLVVGCLQRGWNTGSRDVRRVLVGPGFRKFSREAPAHSLGVPAAFPSMVPQSAPWCAKEIWKSWPVQGCSVGIGRESTR